MSYRTMPSFETIINSTNKVNLEAFSTMKNVEDETRRRVNEGKTRGRPRYITKPPCNCQNKDGCPLDGNCNVSQIIYRATVQSPEMDDHHYYGQAKTFKERFRNHISSFGNRACKQKCALKKFVWKLQDKNKPYKIKWQLIKYSKAYQPGDRMCGICIDEKLTILEHIDSPNTINDEVNGRCFHRAKYKI